MNMKTSESIGNVAAALNLAQTALPAIEKRGKNRHLGNEYMLFDDIVAAVLKTLPAYDLTIIQLPVGTPDGIGVCTRIAHSSGEWIEASFIMPVEERKGINLSQSAGSNITYARRYALASLLMLASEKDDDAAGDGPATTTTTAPKPDKPATNGKVKKNVSPLQWMVDEGYAKNIPHAAEIANLVGNDPETVKNYRAWKDSGATTEVAATHAKAGNSPVKES